MKTAIKTLGDMATLAGIEEEPARARKLKQIADYINELEERLELYAVPMTKGIGDQELYLSIGHMDGIGCRDETIKLLDEKSGAMQLAAGRYQFRAEAAQRCINRIDDYFEYSYKNRTPDELQEMVRYHLAVYTKEITFKKGE